MSISGKSLNGIPLGEKITTSYQILDFFPAFSEKLDRRNNQNNIAVDAEHLFCASASRFLICGDEKMVKKSKNNLQIMQCKNQGVNSRAFLVWGGYCLVANNAPPKCGYFIFPT